MNKLSLFFLSIFSITSAYATVYTGSENLYNDRGQYIGTADHYANLYDRNGIYVMAHRSIDTVESQSSDRNEASGRETMFDRD